MEMWMLFAHKFPQGFPGTKTPITVAPGTVSFIEPELQALSRAPLEDQ